MKLLRNNYRVPADVEIFEIESVKIIFLHLISLQVSHNSSHRFLVEMECQVNEKFRSHFAMLDINYLRLD